MIGALVLVGFAVVAALVCWLLVTALRELGL